MSMADTQRKPRPKRTGSKGSLFGDTETAERQKPKVVVLSSNFTIGPLLSRGCLLPDALEGDAIIESRMPLRLLWFADAVPTNWVEALVASARNVTPIAIRLFRGRKVREIPVGNRTTRVECIAIADVEQLFFKSDKDRARFESLEFGNYALAGSGLRTGVDEALFNGLGESPTSSLKSESPQGERAP